MALVAPQSDTTGIPTAAARCKAPESGPKATREPANTAKSCRTEVRPVRSITGLRAWRRTSRAKSPSAAVPSRTPRVPARSCIRSRTVAVSVVHHRRDGHEDPTHAAMIGAGSPPSSRAASARSSAVAANPNATRPGSTSMRDPNVRNCSSLERSTPCTGKRSVASSHPPSRPSARANPIRRRAPVASAWPDPLGCKRLSRVGSGPDAQRRGR